MEESLVNLVGNTIKELAPAAQLCYAGRRSWPRKVGSNGHLPRGGSSNDGGWRHSDGISRDGGLLHFPPRHLSPTPFGLTGAHALMFRVAKRVVLGMYSWQIRVLLSKKDVTKSAISSRFKR